MSGMVVCLSHTAAVVKLVGLGKGNVGSNPAMCWSKYILTNNPRPLRCCNKVILGNVAPTEIDPCDMINSTYDKQSNAPETESCVPMQLTI